jgi:hypothetical protein
MNEYREYIRNLAEQDSDVVFHNAGNKHAALVMGTMFEFANDNVKIFAGNFSGDVSNLEDYRVGLEKYLCKGKKLQILLQEEKLNGDKEPNLFQLLRLYYIVNPEQIEIRKHPSKVMQSEGNEIHFATADNKMYRLEDDIVSFTATGSFNDTETAKKLNTIFDKIFYSEKSQILNL